MKLTLSEQEFLTRLKNDRPLRLADRYEDRLRQRMRKLGLAEVVKNPRRWALTEAGLSALSALGGDE